MLTFNEGKVCDAIIRHLEVREGVRRMDVRSPEKDQHRHPVELVWKLGARLFALEHTGIEPFEGHMQMDAEAKFHFDPIRTALATGLPPDVFELHVPALAMQGLNKTATKRIQEIIVTWVRQMAPTLPKRSYADYIGDVQPVSLPGVPFPLRLYRFETIVPPDRFQIVHLVTSDRQQQRNDRIRRACEKKFPKLAAWKQAAQARTVLVLEDNDIQLTNHAVVAESFLPLAAARNDRPDEIYIVATCMDPWMAWPILVGDVSYFDLVRNGAMPGWEIEPATLTPLTAKRM